MAKKKPARRVGISKRPEEDRRARQAERLANVMHLQELLLGRGKWNVKSLAAEFGRSEKTVHRYLAVLEIAGVPYYYDGHEAYRSDRFTNLVHQPDPDGPLIFQWGTWTYEQMKPVTATDASTNSNSGSTGSSIPWLPILGGLVIAGGAGFLLARRRPANAASDDRE